MTNPSRIPAGVPTGGQFAAQARTEADVALGDLDASTSAYLEAFDPGDEEARRAEERLAMATESANWHRHRTGYDTRSNGLHDADDVAQDAVLSMLEREANGHVIASDKAYLHTATRGIAATAARGNVRGENAKAMRLFNQAREQRMAELGRELRPNEEDELAAQIRENWHDPRRKPQKDFRELCSPSREVSCDALVWSVSGNALDRDEVLPPSRIGIPGTDEPFEVAPDSYMAQALAALDGEQGDLRHAKGVLWNAISRPEGVPAVALGSISARRATAARAAMSSHPGGVDGAISDWENGEDNAATRVLFAGLGDNLSAVQEQAVVDHMRRIPGSAQAMWLSTIALADNRNQAKYAND